MKSRSGQSLVELALILPILLIILFGIVDFGRLFHAYLTIDHAGREAARAASVQNDDSTIIAKARASTAGLDSDQLTVTLSPGGSRPSGSEVTITLSYQIGFITPLVSSLASPLTLTDTTTMRVE
ncbi:TadE/TadG family type IV pilus assembly protein [Thalassobacillus hwangdonensis]|uniref:TadE/TadG family type IV pilus assembly protein n=1 Tax=Thalassobacillus hwangdonensis TaxID=546108 RepID=A0ABW3L3I0_9BACI